MNPTFFFDFKSTNSDFEPKHFARSQICGVRQPLDRSTYAILPFSAVVVQTAFLAALVPLFNPPRGVGLGL